MPHQITITGVTGNAPYQVQVCDISITNCFNVPGTFSSVPYTFNVPAPLDVANSVIVIVSDDDGCETFQYYSCPATPTPTPTPTATPTPTPTSLCRCITADNTSTSDGSFDYTDCNGNNVLDVIIQSGITYYTCGSNPTNGTNLTITIGDPCSSNQFCPTPTCPPTPTPTPTPTPVPPLPNNTDVYVYIDISSGPYSSFGSCSSVYLTNKLTLCTAVSQWHSDFITDNPNYTGNLYIFETNQPEIYLSFPRMIKSGTTIGVPLLSSFNWLNPLTATPTGAVIPPNWNTPSWVAPTEILFISFVNEVNAGSPFLNISYHGSNPSPSLTLDQLQPTSAYTRDYTEFVFDYTNHWDFFRGVIYPANDFSNISKNFLLHAYAALTNSSNISSAELSTAIGPNFDSSFSSLTYPISNVYVTSNQGLWNYGWDGILNKATSGGGCTITFTPQEFANDLNNILSSGN